MFTCTFKYDCNKHDKISNSMTAKATFYIKNHANILVRDENHNQGTCNLYALKHTLETHGKWNYIPEVLTKIQSSINVYFEYIETKIFTLEQIVSI